MTRYTIYGPVTIPGLTIGSIILLSLMAFMLYQLRRAPGAIQLCLAQVTKVIWLISCLMLTMSRTLEAKLLWIHCAAATVFLSPLLVFEFIIAFFQMRHSLIRLAQFILRLFFAGLVLAVLLNALLPGIYYRSVTVTGPVFRLEWTMMTHFTIVAAYLLVLVNMAICFWYAVRLDGFLRQQALAITVVPVFMFSSHVLDRFRLFPPYMTVVVGMLLSGIYVTWLFYRWRLYTIIPLAHETVSKNMVDGLMVIDDQGYLVEMNETARVLFNRTDNGTGQLFSRLAEEWPDLLELAVGPEQQHREVSRQFPEGMRYFAAELMPLAPAAGRTIGKVLLLKEITRQKQDQARLMEQEKAISALTERNRLGRELHDTHGQFPGYVKSQTQAIRLLLQRGRADDAAMRIDQLISAANDAYNDARESITGLSVSGTDGDFFTLLQKWLGQFRSMSGITVNTTLPTERPAVWIRPEAEMHLLRVIQECFTNVRKHAAAQTIELVFTFTGQNLSVTIADNGQGFDAGAVEQSNRYGLKNINQRLHEIGGSCSINSSPGTGTKLQIQVPLQQEQR